MVGVNFLEVLNCGGGEYFLTKKQSVSQMIDLVMTIDSVQESSKSELSSRGKRPFKVSIFFGKGQRPNGENIYGF